MTTNPKEEETLKGALERIIGMCDVPGICPCGRPNGLPAIVSCAEAALYRTHAKDEGEPKLKLGPVSEEHKKMIDGLIEDEKAIKLKKPVMLVGDTPPMSRQSEETFHGPKHAKPTATDEGEKFVSTSMGCLQCGAMFDGMHYPGCPATTQKIATLQAALAEKEACQKTMCEQCALKATMRNAIDCYDEISDKKDKRIEKLEADLETTHDILRLKEQSLAMQSRNFAHAAEVGLALKAKLKSAEAVVEAARKRIGTDRIHGYAPIREAIAEHDRGKPDA